MRASHAGPSSRPKPGRRRERRDPPLLIVPPQKAGTIQRHHDIREALHDEKARTIRGERESSADH
jgi:hypothetical protein